MLIHDIYDNDISYLQKYSNWFNWTATRLCLLLNNRKQIEVKQLPNDEDWEFVFVDAGDGKKVMSVF